MSTTTGTGLFDDIQSPSTQPQASPSVAAKPGLFDDINAPAPTKASGLFDDLGKAATTFTPPSWYPALVQQAQQNGGFNPDHLLRLMHFESGLGASNTNPQSGATGLIQFMPSTAKGLGTSTDALRRMTPEEQLPYVFKYLKQQGLKPNAPFSDYYSSVLWPAAVGKSGDTVLFRQGTAAYAENKGLDHGNKGYVTKDDAARAAYGPWQGQNSLEAPPWEKGETAPPIPFKNITPSPSTIASYPGQKNGSPIQFENVTGQNLAQATSKIPPDVAAPTHDQRVVANLLGLPFDVEQFILSVRNHDPAVDPKGGTLNPAERFATADAAKQVAEAMGYPVGLQMQGGKPALDAQGRYVYDDSAAQNFLDPKNPAFLALQHHYASRVSSSQPDNPEVELEKSMHAEGLPQDNVYNSAGTLLRDRTGNMMEGIIRNNGGEAMATDTPLQTYGRAAAAVVSPSRIARLLVGDPRADRDLSPGEHLVDTATDLAVWLAGGGIAGGLADAATGALTKSAPEALAKAVTGRLLGSGLPAQAASFVGNQIAIQLPSIGVRAGDLQKQGVGQAAAWRQAVQETAQGMGHTFDPRIFLDPHATPADKLNALVMQGMAGLALLGHAAGKVSDARAVEDRYSQIRPPGEPPPPNGPPASNPAAPERGGFFVGSEQPGFSGVGQAPSSEMPGHVFVSPNTEEGLNYDQASERLNSPGHLQGLETANAIAANRGMGEQKFTSAIGDWQDGAEDTLVGRFDASHSHDELRRAAAEVGLALNQKDVLAVKPSPEGPHVLATFDFPTSDYTEPQVRQILDDHGITNRTIETSPSGIRAIIFKENPDDDFYNRLTRISELTGFNGSLTPVEGGFLTGLGEHDAREDAYPIYRQIIRGEIQRGPEGEGQAPEASPRGGSGDPGRPRGVGESGGTQEGARGSGQERPLLTPTSGSTPESEPGPPSESEPVAQAPAVTGSRSIDDIRADRAKIVGDLFKSLNGSINSGVSAETLLHVGRLVANLAEEGLYHGKELIAHAQGYLRASGIHLTDEQLEQAHLEARAALGAVGTHEGTERPLVSPTSGSTPDIPHTTGPPGSASPAKPTAAPETGGFFNARPSTPSPPVDALALAREVAARPRPLTAEEASAFSRKNQELATTAVSAKAAYARAPLGSPQAATASATLRNSLADHQVLVDGIRSVAGEPTARTHATALASALDDGTYEGARSLAQALKGEPLTPKEDFSIRTLQARLDSARQSRQTLEQAMQARTDRWRASVAARNASAEGGKVKGLQEPGGSHSIREGSDTDPAAEGKQPGRSPAQEPESTAAHGSLPKPVPGENYLDVDPNTSMEEMERRSLRSPKEIASVFDANGRLIIAPKEGIKNQVLFHPEEYSRFEDGLLTHNHPSGTCFSVRDLTFAAKANLRAMRVVGRFGTFQADRPQGGWGGQSEIERRADRAFDDSADAFLLDPRVGGASGEAFFRLKSEISFECMRNEMSKINIVIKRYPTK